ncbi:MAG TPA: four helix bundle protein [Phycisphaerae bacterium]|nr:four helix bundle protein [Phycisphaerae bacterium]
MTKKVQSANEQRRTSEQRYDLEERTAAFGEAIVRLARKIPADSVTRPLISQLVRAGTSVGANYCEADDAGSKKEFRYRISICQRESRESKYWLRMVAGDAPTIADEARHHWREANELHLIFAAIYRNSTTTDRAASKATTDDDKDSLASSVIHHQTLDIRH